MPGKGKKSTDTCSKDQTDCASGGASAMFHTLLPGMNEGEKLDKFINRVIRPDDDFNKRSKEVIDKLVRSIQEMSGAFKSKIKRILKSGSLGKGTHVRDKSDIDLIVFYNGYSSVAELQADKPNILKKLEEHVKREFPGEFKFQGRTPFSVQFTMSLKSGGSTHEVDLLPALDITEGGQSLAPIYSEMKTLNGDQRGHYSSCLAPLQKDFVLASDGVPTPGRVKDLILVLKYWAKEEKVPLRSYFLELFVIRLWREAGKPSTIDMQEWLTRVLHQLVDIKNTAIAFPDHYNYRDYNPKVRKPYLLDPANPYRNVAPSGGSIATIEKKSREFLARMT